MCKIIASLLSLLCLMALTAACQHPSKEAQRQQTLDQALTLMDEGKQFEDQGSLSLALERYNRAASIYNSPLAYFRMGRLFEGAGQNEKAAAAYNEALKLAPDYQEARFAMLALGFHPDDFEPSQADVEMAQQWAQQNPAAALVLADDAMSTQTAAGEEEQALDLEEIADQAANQRMPTPSEVKAIIFNPKDKNKEEDLPSATDPTYSQDVDIILGTHAYHQHKADRLRERGQFEQALVEYGRALQADPAQMETRLDIGDVMMKMERYPRALHHYERAVEQFPQSPRPLLKIGNYYSTLDQPEKARDYYHQSLQKDPYYAEAFNNLAVLAMKEKDYTQAAKLLDELIEQHPDYTNAYLNRGIIAADVEKDQATALKHFRRYVELGGERSNQVRKWIREMEGTAEPAGTNGK